MAAVSRAGRRVARQAGSSQLSAPAVWQAVEEKLWFLRPGRRSTSWAQGEPEMDTKWNDSGELVKLNEIESVSVSETNVRTVLLEGPGSVSA